jgi:hypothetical protein
MEDLPIRRTATGIHIDGVPDAVRLIQIVEPKARQAADLKLHKKDLDFCLSCLEELATVPNDRVVIRQALWRSAVVHFVKCFTGSSARIELSPRRIYGNDPRALQAYQYVKDLRDRHLVHDESSYGQCITGAAINDGQKSFKVEKIICLSMLTETLDDNNCTMLRELATVARASIVREYDTLCESITAELERQPYEVLAKREPATITVPTASELRTRRAVLGRGRRRR